MSEQKIIDRYQGTLVGAAIGDALGQPVEFISMTGKFPEYRRNDSVDTNIREFKDTLRRKYNNLVTEMFPNPFGIWNIGEYTDDFTQTIMLAESLIEQGYDPEDYARRLVRWRKEDGRGCGYTTRLALRLIEAGASWQDSGKLALEYGAAPANGAVMRTSPVGLYFKGNPDRIDQAADEIASITHGAIQSRESAKIASQLIALLLTGCSKKEAFDDIASRYPASLEETLHSYKDRFKHPGGAYVTLSIAIKCFYYAGNFEEAVVKAVNLDGDTDTQACVTGAIAGAHWGYESIPYRWKNQLNPLTGEEIANTATKLYLLNKQL